MAPRKNSLTEYKISELQAWHSEVRDDMCKLREKIDSLDRKNDKGFEKVQLQLTGINDFIKGYKDNDLPRINRMEQGALGALVIAVMALIGVVGEKIWAHIFGGG